MLLNESIIWVLIQELFENGLFDIEELTSKYTLSKRQVAKIKEIYNALYEE